MRNAIYLDMPSGKYSRAKAQAKRKKLSAFLNKPMYCSGLKRPCGTHVWRISETIA